VRSSIHNAIDCALELKAQAPCGSGSSLQDHCFSPSSMGQLPWDQQAQDLSRGSGEPSLCRCGLSGGWESLSAAVHGRKNEKDRAVQKHVSDGGDPICWTGFPGMCPVVSKWSEDGSSTSPKSITRRDPSQNPMTAEEKREKFRDSLPESLGKKEQAKVESTVFGIRKTEGRIQAHGPAARKP